MSGRIVYEPQPPTACEQKRCEGKKTTETALFGSVTPVGRAGRNGLVRSTTNHLMLGGSRDEY